MRIIVVVPHDPGWAQEARDESRRLLAIFAPRVRRIFHIGSTSIPGIKAKPIIDLLVEVDDIQAIDAYNQEMAQLGYISKGEDGITGQRLYIKGTEEVRTHHVHIYQAGNPEVPRHIDFRDYLLSHPQDAQAYSRLKEGLAVRFRYDAEGYLAGKTEFIRDIERKALIWKSEHPET